MAKQSKVKDKRSGYKSSVQYSKWKSIVELGKNFPTDRFFEEISESHKNRISSRLARGKASGKRLAAANALDIEIRAKATEYRTKAMRISYGIDDANGALKDFLIAEKYVEGRTQADRNHAVEVILRKGRTVGADLDNFVDVMQEFIDDIDKSGWALKRIQEALEMNSRPERVI